MDTKPLKLNRHDITNMVWKLLAKQPCQLSMSFLHRRFPVTNWTTVVEVDSSPLQGRMWDVLNAGLLKAGFIADRKDGHAWEVFVEQRSRGVVTGRRCCRLTLNFTDHPRGVEITPYFYNRPAK